MGARLEDRTAGATVRGIIDNNAVEVRAVQWHGTSAITLTYRTAAGAPGERLLYRDDEPSLTIEEAGRAWSFDATPQGAPRFGESPALGARCAIFGGRRHVVMCVS